MEYRDEEPAGQEDGTVVAPPGSSVVVAAASVSAAPDSRAATAWFSLQAFSSLRHRDYRYLWSGVLLMGAGQRIQEVTLGWLIYDITSSSLLLGALNGLRTLPFLVVGPTAGIAADRMDRRKLMLITQAVLMLTALSMWPLVALGMVRAPHLFLFALVSGIAWSVNQPVRQTLIPSVVPREDLMSAVALNSMGFNIVTIVGPALGGLLIAWFGVSSNFLVQGTAYAGVLVLISLMYVPPLPARAHKSSPVADLKEALAYVWASPAVLALLATSFIVHVFAQPYQTLMPVFQKDVLRVGPEGLGLLLAAPGLGAIAVTAWSASFGATFHRSALPMLASLAVLGGTLILFSRTTSLPLALLILVVLGGARMLVLVTNIIMLQIIVPDQLRGRVMSIYMLDRGLAPAGAFLAGVSTHFVGAPLTVTLMGSSVILLTILVGWRMPHANANASYGESAPL